MKKASANPCNIIVKTPKKTGTVILMRCSPTGPLVSRACCDSIPNPNLYFRNILCLETLYLGIYKILRKYCS